MERRRAGCGVGTGCGAETPRAEKRSRVCGGTCCRRVPGRSGGGGLGLGGSVSRGSERLELVANGRAAASVTGLALDGTAVTSDLGLQALR